jgi:Monooxygenase af470-like
MAENSMKALRQTVDLSAHPDLVVVYLGMTVNVLTGVKTLFGFGPKIEGSVAARPDGLLLHENLFYSLFPLHIGMRQYWRDFESLERFTRTDPHREWWKQFLRDTGGTGFWHELFLHEAVSKQSMSMSSGLLDFSILPRRYPRKGASFRLASD